MQNVSMQRKRKSQKQLISLVTTKKKNALMVNKNIK